MSLLKYQACMVYIKRTVSLGILSVFNFCEYGMSVQILCSFGLTLALKCIAMFDSDWVSIFNGLLPISTFVFKL